MLSTYQRKTSSHKWQSVMSTTGECLAYLRSSGAMVDVTIIFPGCKKTIQAHRWLLSMRSPVFEAMLCGPMAVKDELVLPQDDPDIFEWMLEHLYKDGHSVPENIEMAVQVFSMAHKYQLDTIVEMYEEHIQRKVDSSNFPVVYMTANFLDSQTILGQCSKLLAVSTDDILKSSKLGVLSRSAFRNLLEDKFFAPSSETLVFTGICKWGQAQLENERLSKEETQREEFKQMLKNLSKSDFSETAMNKMRLVFTEIGLALPSDAKIDVEVDAVEKKSSTRQLKPQEEKVEAASEDSEKDASNQLRQIVQEFLPAVRYLAMATEEFVDILCYDIFTQEESLAILKKMRGAKGVTLPHFVSQHSVEMRKPIMNTIIISGNNLSKSNYNFIFRDKETFTFLHTFEVSKTISLVSIASTCFVSLLEGELTVLDSANLPVGNGSLLGLSCRFKNPVKLRSDETYEFSISMKDVLYSNNTTTISWEYEGLTLTGNALIGGKIEISYFLDLDNV